MKYSSNQQLKSKFKEIYREEFDDPNESFMDFLLELIPKEVVLKTLKKGKKIYYSNFFKYK